MTLENAKKLIQDCADQMAARYHKPVFDEWAIVSIAGSKGSLLSYTGPRREGFRQNFLTDIGSLRKGIFAEERAAGDYEFSHEGVGTGFEAFLVLGKGTYLICNHTAQTMDTITKDPLWLAAQVPFVELSDKVRSDPVS
jgi:hypothetical protein